MTEKNSSFVKNRTFKNKILLYIMFSFVLQWRDVPNSILFLKSNQTSELF